MELEPNSLLTGVAAGVDRARRPASRKRDTGAVTHDVELDSAASVGVEIAGFFQRCWIHKLQQIAL